MNRDDVIQFGLKVSRPRGEVMTEADWHTNEFPGRLLEYSRRITGLSWPARCRRYRFASTAILRAFVKAGSQEKDIENKVLDIVESAEGVWEGLGSLDAVRETVLAAGFPTAIGVRPDWRLYLLRLLGSEPLAAVRDIVGETQFGRTGSSIDFKAAQCALIRDIFGNPFRPVAFDPAWRTDTAVSLAKHMYENRDFSAMPILADALQDAGCDSDDILSHCRDEKQPHVRGCWVVDLVLGKA
jgi:hypothetical protein